MSDSKFSPRVVLVTGGAGFIGSNFVRYVLANHDDVRIINLDNLTYAGNLENLADVADHACYSFIKMDICDTDGVVEICTSRGVDSIVHFAAESHVDRSISRPAEFVRTNVQGTLSLLQVARGCGDLRFVQVGTDEVYGTLGSTGRFSEFTPIDPHSPYSASKAAADHLVSAFHSTYGLPAMTTRCSNNYGPYQFPEKMIPLMINNARHGRALPVYGDGSNVRDWLYVEDHCRALWKVLTEGRTGRVYNIGGNNERANLDVVKTLLRHLDKPESLISFVHDRPGHDFRYAIDATRIRDELDWAPTVDFDTGIKRTIHWYLEHQEWLDHVTSGAYQQYYEDLYVGR